MSLVESRFGQFPGVFEKRRILRAQQLRNARFYSALTRTFSESAQRPPQIIICKAACIDLGIAVFENVFDHAIKVRDGSVLRYCRVHCRSPPGVFTYQIHLSGLYPNFITEYCTCQYDDMLLLLSIILFYPPGSQSLSLCASRPLRLSWRAFMMTVRERGIYQTDGRKRVNARDFFTAPKRIRNE